MIALMRINNRLIHGQVALLWTKHLQANRIIVANDTIVKNEVQVAALKMACPATAKCSVLSVEDSIKVLNDPRAERLRTFIVVNNPTDARRIVEAVPSVPLVNISNYGHLGDDLKERIKITDTSDHPKTHPAGVPPGCQRLAGGRGLLHRHLHLLVVAGH